MTTTTSKSEKYIQAVGRRKTATAQVRFYEAAKTTYTINDKDFSVYFPTETLRATVTSPFSKIENVPTFKITAKIAGGGISAQAEALRHAISRALLVHDITMRGSLKKVGFLKRDARAKERRKFGLKKARKAPQWSKR